MLKMLTCSRCQNCMQNHQQKTFDSGMGPVLLDSMISFFYFPIYARFDIFKVCSFSKDLFFTFQPKETEFGKMDTFLSKL